jgi:hypothetical protein
MNPFDDPVSERLLLEMYNENHQCMFGLDLPKDWFDFSRIKIDKGEIFVGQKAPEDLFQQQGKG